jgi:hypothetical protein
MRRIVTLCIGLLALLLSGSQARGDDDGDAYLTVCNKGNAPISVVVAVEPDVFFGKVLNVSGWTNISPGECAKVYQEPGGTPAYIGFGLADSQGHVVAGHIEIVPDLGILRFGTKVLTKSHQRLCTRGTALAYRIRTDPEPDCASFRYDRNDPGGYVSFQSALYFQPVAQKCSIEGFNNQVSCYGGEYYLNIKATAASREMLASVGSENGREQKAAEPSLGDSIMQAIGKAAAEKRQEEERAQAEGRKKVTVCVPESLITEWRNPTPCSKMEKFKEHFKKALIIHGQNSSSDMTQYWWIDDRVYPTYDPATPMTKVVFFDRPGSCGRTGIRDSLTISP